MRIDVAGHAPCVIDRPYECRGGGFAVIYQLPDQSPEAMEDWVRNQYLADGIENGYAQSDTRDPLWLLAAKAHTHYGDLKQAS